MPGLAVVDIAQGITAIPKEAQQEGTATLKMPDGQEIALPILLDSNGGKFVDIRKLQPR